MVQGRQNYATFLGAEPELASLCKMYQVANLYRLTQGRPLTALGQVHLIVELDLGWNILVWLYGVHSWVNKNIRQDGFASLLLVRE